MKAFRISWNALIEDESLLEGRSLVYAENQEKALEELYSHKAHEYRIKSHMIRIVSIYEVTNLSKEEE